MCEVMYHELFSAIYIFFSPLRTLIAGICGSNEVSVAIELSMKMVNDNDNPVVHCRGGLIGQALNFFSVKWLVIGAFIQMFSFTDLLRFYASERLNIIIRTSSNRNFKRKFRVTKHTQSGAENPEIACKNTIPGS